MSRSQSPVHCAGTLRISPWGFPSVESVCPQSCRSFCLAAYESRTFLLSRAVTPPAAQRLPARIYVCTRPHPANWRADLRAARVVGRGLAPFAAGAQAAARQSPNLLDREGGHVRCDLVE